jgi:hypothetical protein
VCTEELAPGTEVTNGRFRIALEDDCVDDVHADPDRWVEVEVEGVVLGRTKAAAVPYALEADRAVDSAGVLDARLAAPEADDALRAATIAADDAAIGVLETALADVAWCAARRQSQRDLQ